MNKVDFLLMLLWKIFYYIVGILLVTGSFLIIHHYVNKYIEMMLISLLIQLIFWFGFVWIVGGPLSALDSYISNKLMKKENS